MGLDGLARSAHVGVALQSGVALRSLAAVLIVALAPHAAESQRSSAFSLPGRLSALLIGTDTYGASREWARLSSPVLDATTIAKSLANDFAFDTTVVRNATKDDIIRAIVSQGKRAEGPDDWTLVFVASHGYFDDERGQGYLVFRDSKPRGDDVSRSSYLSLSELRGIVEGYKAGHVMLVIDACYAGTIDPDIRSGTDRGERASGSNRREVESSLLRRSQYRSRQYLTSGGKEYVPDGRPGAHSPFAGVLIGALRQASIEAQPLTFSQIVGRMAESAIEPLPRHNAFRGHEPGGDFILVPRSFVTSLATQSMPNSLQRDAPASRGANDVPVRRTDGAPISSGGTPSGGPVTAAAAAFSVLVTTDVRTDGRAAGDTEALKGLVHSAVQAAFVQRGVARVLAASDGSADGPCAPAARGAGRCVEVAVAVTWQVANNRQTVLVTLTAMLRSTKQVLATEAGRAGPYTLDVPVERVAERAATSRLPAFVEAVLAAAGAAR